MKHFIALLLLFGGNCAFTQEPDPAEAKLRAFLNCRVTADALVFAGDKFPELRLSDQVAAKEYLGEFALQAEFFDASLNRVTEPIKPGPYAALVEIKPAKQRPTTRYVTLYRLPAALDPARRLGDEKTEVVAEALGLPAANLVADGELIRETVKDKPWSAAAADPRVASVVAGLALPRAEQAQPRKNNDALARERQWWVSVRRKRWGLDTRFPQLLARPEKVAGKVAATVREGSLAEAGIKPDTAEKIDAALAAWSADTDEAFAVCVVRRGVIVLHKAYGMRGGEPMTVTTKSWMASVTKTMSATLMMMCVDQGLADLDLPIERYSPAFAGIKVEQPLTIRHLYTHTNGLEKWPGQPDEAADVEFRVAEIYPHLKVGGAWGYNGLGYTLGGKLLEDLTGEAVPQLYLRHLLEPLGCPNTDVLGTHADAFSVPLDMAKFGQMLLNRGKYGDLQFMSEATFAKMLPQKLTMLLGPAATKTFGIGLDGQPDSGKFGHGAASAATFSVDANDDLIVIMTRNKIGTNYDKYNGKFWQAIKDGMEK